MIDENVIKQASENWHRASKEFGFEVISPYSIEINSKLYEVSAFLPGYGCKNGAIAVLLDLDEEEVDYTVWSWSNKNDIFCSMINYEVYAEGYDSSAFKELLEDWVI